MCEDASAGMEYLEDKGCIHRLVKMCEDASAGMEYLEDKGCIHRLVKMCEDASAGMPGGQGMYPQVSEDVSGCLGWHTWGTRDVSTG